MNPGDLYNPYGLFRGLFIPSWLAKYSAISWGAKVAFAQLALFAREGGEACVTEDEVGAELGVSGRQARIYVKELVSHGLVFSKRQGQGKPNLYTFPWNEALRESLRAGKEPQPAERNRGSVLEGKLPEGNYGSVLERKHISALKRNRGSAPTITQACTEKKKTQVPDPPSEPSVLQEGGAAAPAPLPSLSAEEILAGAEQAGKKAQTAGKAGKNQPDLPGMHPPPPREIRSAPRPPTPPGDPRIAETMALWESLLGYVPTSQGADRSAVKEMLARGYSPERIVACARWLYSDPWWADKHRALQNVLKRIEEWHHQGEPAFHVERNGKARNETAADAHERTMAEWRLKYGNRSDGGSDLEVAEPDEVDAGESARRGVRGPGGDVGDGIDRRRPVPGRGAGGGAADRPQ